jgi:hypothetical protein
MLTTEKTLSDKTTLIQAAKIFDSIPKIRETSAAFCIAHSYVTAKERLDINSDFGCSADQLAKLQKMKIDVNKYTKAEELYFEDVPNNTQNSSLREAYSMGRLMEHCPANKELNASELDKLIKLIFDHQIRNNFANVYKDDLLTLKNLQLRMHAPADSFIPDMSDKNVSRQAILRANNNLKKLLLQSPQLMLAEQLFIKKMSKRISNIIENHDCTNALWIESIEIQTAKGNLNENCATRD